MVFSWWTWLMRQFLYALGLSAPVRIVKHPQPALLRTATGDDGKKRTTTLEDVLNKCPSLLGWYTPTTWLSRYVSLLFFLRLRRFGRTFSVTSLRYAFELY
jgi:hypothetical protein